MAPMKRARSAGAVRGPVKARCAAVAKALKHAEPLPAAVRDMLAHTVSDNLAVKKADRHPHQETMVGMMREALTAFEAKLKADVDAAEAKVAGGAAEKTSNSEAQAAAQAESDNAGAAVEAKKAEISEKKSALDAANDAHNAAVNAKKALEKKLATDEEKKTRLDKFKEGLPALLEGADKATAKKALKAVADCGFEDFMMDTVPGALEKTAAGRGTYDNFVLKAFEEQVAAVVAAAHAAYDSEAQAKPATDGKVESTEAALTAAKEALETAKGSLGDLQTAQKTAAGALKAASKTVESFDATMESAASVVTTAKKALEDFQKGAKKAFAELDSLTDETPGFVFKNIGGVKVDAGILTLCKNAAESGSISPAALAKISQFEQLSAAARWAVRYALTEFTWTEAAHDAAVALMASVPAEPDAKKRKTAGYYIMMDGVKCDSKIVEECQKAIDGVGDGRVSVEDAHKVFEKVKDGNKVTTIELWTIRYCLSAFKFTEAAKTWLAEAMKAEKPSA